MMRSSKCCGLTAVVLALTLAAKPAAAAPVCPELGIADPVVRAALQGADPGRRRAAARQLARRRGPDASSALCRILRQDRAAGLRALAARALRRYLPLSKPWLERAAERDEDADVRRAARASLGALPRPRRPARHPRPPLSRLERDRDAGLLPPPTPRQLLQLARAREQLQSSDPGARLKAVRRLGRLRVVASVQALERTLRHDRSDVVRAAAARSLKRIGGKRAHRALKRRAGEDDDPSVNAVIKTTESPPTRYGASLLTGAIIVTAAGVAVGMAGPLLYGNECEGSWACMDGVYGAVFMTIGGVVATASGIIGIVYGLKRLRLERQLDRAPLHLGAVVLPGGAAVSTTWTF